jgi:hypothetical protein
MEGPAVTTSLKKRANGKLKAADKSARRKRAAKTGVSPSISIEQQLAQRKAELAIINSIQEGLASKLDMQAIYDLVGDKIRDIFDAQVLLIANSCRSRLPHLRLSSAI